MPPDAEPLAERLLDGERLVGLREPPKRGRLVVLNKEPQGQDEGINGILSGCRSSDRRVGYPYRESQGKRCCVEPRDETGTLKALRFFVKEKEGFPGLLNSNGCAGPAARPVSAAHGH